jgi:hypothetical protein
MNLYLKTLLILSILLIYQPVFAYDRSVTISDADEEWGMDMDQAGSDVLDSSEVEAGYGEESIVCHGDEIWNNGFDVISSNAIDASESLVKLSIETLICHGDESWNDGLVSVEIDNAGTVINDKTPVLFVPGILGTKIKDQNGNFIWVDLDRMINPLRLDSYSDDFMDPLSFDSNLLPRNNLSLDNVIKSESYLHTTYNYTEGLINEFASQGYAENRDFFTFPYDWRYGVSGKYPDGKTNRDLLMLKIEELSEKSPTGRVDVIAHSLGGLVVKKYIMDMPDPKIGKLVFVGVPNLGSPRSMLALLDGTDLGIFGLNPQEFKKISQNLPVSYDLLPTKGYYTKKGSYLTVTKSVPMGQSQSIGLNYEEANTYFNDSGLNAAGTMSAGNLHSVQYDFFDVRTKGVDAYNIVGCKSDTYRGLIDYQTIGGEHSYYGEDFKTLSGDDTVPFESANSVVASDEKNSILKKPNMVKCRAQMESGKK